MERRFQPIKVGEPSVEETIAILRGLKELALEGRALLEASQLDEFGRLLHDGWELKKQLAGPITNGEIEQMYSSAREAGALGGKICGAGGGGFMLVY